MSTNDLSALLANQSADTPPAQEKSADDLSQLLSRSATPPPQPAQTSNTDLSSLLAVSKPADTPIASSSTTSDLSNLLGTDQTAKYGQDIGTRGLTADERSYGEKNPEDMDHEPWYHRAWEWANSPFYDFHKWGTRTGAGTFERGLETGLEDLGNNIFNPMQVALAAATFGGSAVEAAGIGALRSIGVSKLAAPAVAQTAKLLMTAGFSAQMLGGLMTQSPQFLDAMKNGDYETATRLGTNIVAGAGFLAMGLKHGGEDYKVVKKLWTKGTPEQIAEAARIAGDRRTKIQMAKDNARATSEAIGEELERTGGRDATRESGIRQWLNSDGDIERMKKQRGIAEGTIKPRDLSPEEQKAATEGWNNELVYVAVDKKNLEIIRNAGIKEGVTYHATPTEALENALLPDSGNKKDLAVLSVPRREVEGSTTIRETPRMELPPKYVYRVRPVGEEGIPAGNNHVTQSLDKAQDALRVREKNQPDVKHEIVATDVNQLNPEDFRLNVSEAGEHPFGSLTKDIPESDVVKMADVKTRPPANITSDANTTGGDNKTGVIQVDLRSPEGKQLGRLIADISPDGTTAHVNAATIDDKLNTGITENKSPYRGHGYGIGVYMEAMRRAKAKGMRFFASDDTGRTSPDAERVWQSLGKKFKMESTGEAHKAKYIIDLSKISDKELAAAAPAKPITTGAIKSLTSHMPAHELVMDTNTPTGELPKVTGQATSLRPFGAEDMPGDTSRFRNKLSTEEKQRYLDGLDYAINHMTEADKSIARTLRQTYDNSFAHANEHGLIRQWIEAYHPQAWANQEGGLWKTLFGKDTEDVTNTALNKLRADTQAGRFDTNINAAKHRAYSTEFEGVMAGQVFATDDLTTHLYNHMHAIDNAIANREYLDQLRNIKGPDGRPAAVLAGTSRKFGGDENPALAIDAKAVRAIHIDPKLVTDMQITDPRTGTTPLEDGLKKGTIKKLRQTVVDENGNKVPAYAWTSEGYVSPDSPHTRGWAYVGTDTAGNPAYMHGEMKIHPDFAEHVTREIGAEKSALQNSAALRTLGKLSGEAKGTLLSFSPFHMVQEGLRAVMVGINPFNWEHININADPLLQLGAKYGLERNDYKAQNVFSNGMASHSKIIGAIPGLNRIQNWIQDFTFNKYIPGLKDRAFKKIFSDLRDANPHLTEAEAATRAAGMTNDVFGGQNWHDLGVSASSQDFMRMTMLAPDWLVSEMRMLGRAAGLIDKETGVLARKQMAKMAAGLWIAARVMNMITTGQMHNEAPFGVVHKKEDGTETVFSLRTLPTDLVHAVSDPENFVRGRVNPLIVKPAVEFLTGRDTMGRRATIASQLADVRRGVMPIVGQSLIKGNPLSSFEQVYKGIGGNVYKYRTEAEKLAQEYASDRMPTGPVNNEELAQHQKEIALEDKFRQGTISKAELSQELPKRRVTDIVRRAPMNALQARFDRLPMSEAINVWDAATPAEKDLLHDQIWKKRQRWLKEHKPLERDKEPVWRKMLSTWADLR
jgi:hypothetical protein